MTATQVRRIDEVAVVFNGKTPSKSEQRDSGHPVLKVKDVDALGRFRGTFSGHVGADLARKHVRQQLAGGETLVLNAAHNVTHVASKTFYADREVAGSLATGEWLIVRWSTETVDSRFGNHWINAPDTRFRIRRLVNGIHLYPKDVARLQIPLPPLAEQRRIAGILDAADALRAKRREALAQLDTLLQSTFLDMFGDPVANPMGWEIEGFDNWLDNIDSGWSPKCLNRKALIGEWGVLKLGAVTWCEFDDSGQKALPPSLAPRPELEVAPGDLLFTRKNTHDLVAAVAYVHKVRPRLMLSDLIFRLRLKSGIEMKPAFLWQLLIQPKQRQVIQRFAGGSAGSMPNISKAKLKTLKLIKPPLDLQHHFAAIAESVECQKARQRAHLAELDTLFASLQSRAFRGDL